MLQRIFLIQGSPALAGGFFTTRAIWECPVLHLKAHKPLTKLFHFYNLSSHIYLNMEGYKVHSVKKSL